MELYIYPTSRKQLFTNREHLRSEINLNIARLEKGQGKHLCLIGLRKIGKTELLKYSLSEQVTSNHAIYLDLEEAGLTPEAFARYYYSMIGYWALTHGQVDAGKYHNLNFVIQQAMNHNQKTIAEVGLALKSELEKQKIDQRYLLGLVFGLPDRLALEKKNTAVVYIDEFQEILQLNNFRQIGNILALFRSNIQKQNYTRYIIAGSATRIIENIISAPSSPIFGHFSLRYVEPFTKEDTFELAGKLLDFLTDADNQMIYKLTGGHPYYIYSLCSRLESIQERFGPLKDMVKKAFVLEVSSKDGDINKHCHYVFTTSLTRARGYATLRTILLELAQQDGLTLSGIAGLIKKGTGETLSYLNNLMDVDLLIKRDKKYYFKDQILQYWLAMFRLGIETMLPTDKVINELVSELDEKYQRATTELGIAKQSEIQDLIEEFNGQQVNGTLFGIEGTVTLPTFENVGNYSSSDEQIEIDLVCRNHEMWFVEVKWKNRATGIREVRDFHRKINDVRWQVKINKNKKPILWFISKSGFTRPALKFCSENGIFVSSNKELKDIRTELKNQILSK